MRDIPWCLERNPKPCDIASRRNGNLNRAVQSPTEPSVSLSQREISPPAEATQCLVLSSGNRPFPLVTLSVGPSEAR